MTAYKRLAYEDATPATELDFNGWEGLIQNDGEYELDSPPPQSRKNEFIAKIKSYESDLPEFLKVRAWNQTFYVAGINQRAANRDDPHYDEIEDQVSALRIEAEEEGDPFDQGSADLLLQYCHELAADIQPGIVRLANGALRALWQNERKDQIGIQILSSDNVQFIILRDRGGRTLKTLGVEEPSTVEEIVYTLRMKSLWFHG